MDVTESSFSVKSEIEKDGIKFKYNATYQMLRQSFNWGPFINNNVLELYVYYMYVQLCSTSRFTITCKLSTHHHHVPCTHLYCTLHSQNKERPDSKSKTDEVFEVLVYLVFISLVTPIHMLYVVHSTGVHFYMYPVCSNWWSFFWSVIFYLHRWSQGINIHTWMCSTYMTCMYITYTYTCTV